ncbi:MAG: TRAP transporter large permease subunit [Cupriavidus sp.]
MTGLAVHYGSTAFLLVSVLLTIVFGTILEGAPALILFGPLLAPIAGQAGVHPLHFGTVMVIAMGFGLFMQPLGLGLFATCAMTGTRVEQVAGPMLKYLALLLLILLLLVLMPSLTLWLPRLMRLA